MRRLLKEFAAALAFMAVVVTILAASKPGSYPLYGIVSVSAALLWATIRVTLPKISVAIKRLNSYTSVVQRLVEAQADLADSQATLFALREAMLEEREPLIREGHRQVIGAILADGTTSLPEPIAVTLDEAGQVVITARVSQNSGIRRGGRFEVRRAGSHDALGVVEVSQVDSRDGYVHMVCVDPVTDAFWAALALRAVSDPSPPTGILFARTTLPANVQALLSSNEEV